jgi:hypothetical protein
MARGRRPHPETRECPACESGVLVLRRQVPLQRRGVNPTMPEPALDYYICEGCHVRYRAISRSDELRSVDEEVAKFRKRLNELIEREGGRSKEPSE